MSLMESKSILAKLMATENLKVEQRGVRTASFDVKNRVLTVPTLDNNISSSLYDLFMGHEVGHALYTPLDGMMDAIDRKMNMSVINVVEDCRIERKIKYKYPGLKNSFLRGYNELMQKDFFETRGKNLNSMNFIDRLNLFAKGGALLNIQFNEEERELMREVDSTETYEDVLEVAEKIVRYMKSVQEKEEEVQKQIMSRFDSDDEDDYDDYDSRYGDEEDTLYDDLDEEHPVSGDEEGDDEEFESIINSGARGQKEIRSFTDDAYRRNESQLFADKQTEYVYVNIPKLNLDHLIYDYKKLYKRYVDEDFTVNRKAFNAYRKESNKVVSYLIKEFEMRKNADQMKRASTAKTGDLNMSKIYSYNFNDDIFKKLTIVPGGKSHGLVMFLDWSGSMLNHISNTMKQLLNLVLFCKKANIPFEVYSFIDEDPEYHIKNDDILKKDDLNVGNFKLMNILSSRMSANEFTTAGGALMVMSGICHHGRVYTPEWFRLTGTPLNETLIAAMEIIPQFQKKYKLQIVNTVVLTDGEGGNLTNYYDGQRMQDTRYITVDGMCKKTSHVVLVDTVTKNEEKYRIDSIYNSFSQTNALIRLLKKRTNSNVIGFYVTTNRELMNKLSMFFPRNISALEIDNIKLDFRKNKYVISTNTSFDDYYILRSNALNTEDDTEFVVRENATTRGLVSAFSKYTSARVNNRVILNRFIGLIA